VISLGELGGMCWNDAKAGFQWISIDSQVGSKYMVGVKRCLYLSAYPLFLCEVSPPRVWAVRCFLSLICSDILYIFTSLERNAKFYVNVNRNKNLPGI